MTAPVVQSVARATGTTADDGSGNFFVANTMPATIPAGCLLLAFVVSINVVVGDYAGNPLGWTSFNTYLNSGSTAKLSVFNYGPATGSEAGSTAFGWQTTTTGKGLAWHIYAISGVSTPLSSAIAGSTVVTGNSTAPDPGSLSPAWGSADTLWLPVEVTPGNTADPITYPTNYTTNGVYNEIVSGGGIASSYRANTASSEDVGAFTISATLQWATVTFAIKPTSGGKAPPPPRSRTNRFFRRAA